MSKRAAYLLGNALGVVVVAALPLFPWGVAFTINLLAGTALPYNARTWAAGAVLLAFGILVNAVGRELYRLCRSEGFLTVPARIAGALVGIGLVAGSLAWALRVIVDAVTGR